MTDKYPIPYSKESVYFQYDVKDFNRAKKFYGEILGLEKTWDGGEEAGRQPAVRGAHDPGS